MDSITLTKDQLQAAITTWEHQARSGQTRPVEEARALPVEQVARESTDHLWSLLAPAA
ncbi:hypothetical protein J2W35_003282 [Variovorax boronicumulans]|uniref:hypothetical protein n=1 Tax=Variovorax boronicumulans TaxID=436515 RepID=UPI0027817D87|nr:hypothetical protein [Variovorax boronicumulans]MDQ0082923.1 hypothetical protein [Variovorax boronicumulans]